MRLAPLSLVFGVVSASGCVGGYGAGLTPVELAYQQSLRTQPARAVVPIHEPATASAPYVVVDTRRSSSTLNRAVAGSLYEVRGVVHQLAGELTDYNLAVEGLPEGVKIQETELFDGNRFRLVFSVDSAVDVGSYQYKMTGTKEGTAMFELKSVVPVETDVDVIRIAAYNDFHGYIVQQNGTLSSSQDNRNKFSGALSMTLRLEDLRSDMVEKDLLLVGAGDSIGGSLYESAVNDDDPTKEITRLWGTQCQAIGNHEFDKGYKDILKAGTEHFKFPQLAANVVWKEKVEDGKEIGEVFMDSTHTTVVRRQDRDYKIGFVGVTLQGIPSVVLADGVAPLDFLPPAPEANKYAKLLKDEGCDFVICMFHQGGLDTFKSADDFMDNNDDEFARFLRELNKEGKYVDILATGHTHRLYNWNSPSVINPNLPPIVQTGSFGVNLATFEILVDRDTGDLVVEPSGVIVDTVRQSLYYDYEAKQWMRGKDGIDTVLDQNEVESLSPTLIEINNIISAAVDIANLRGNEVTAKSTITWPQPSGTETILGCHIADAMVAATLPYETGIQMAFTNDGGIRKDWVPTAEEGITVRHVFDTLPFANELEAMNLTGAQIKSLLEAQWIALGGGERTRMFHLQTSGLRYQYDDTKPLGQRVLAASLEFWNSATEEFDPITPTGSYRLVTNNFLSAGGDAFLDFVDGTDRRPIAKADNEYAMEYNKAMAADNDGYLVPPAVERAYNVNADQRDSVILKTNSHRHGNHVHLVLTYSVQEPIAIQGPFRVMWNVDGNEYQSVQGNQTSILFAYPLVVELDVDGCSTKGCVVEATLMSEVFHKNPLPHGLTKEISLDKDGALASIAGLGLVGILALLLA